ncbi:MAG: AMP-binding protein, partial [Phycisphaerales bacterium]|nr:AMP-binding protein [Phycisphaerales bacterium]
LAKLGPEAHRLIWTFHHILVDAWSVSIILNDVQAAYDALAAGSEPGLPPVSKFRNAVAALARGPEPGVEQHWRTLLDGFDSPTALPALREEEDLAGRRTAPAVTLARLEGEAYERVRTFARENRLTLSTMMLGAWALVLSRYGMSDDVVFGATFSGRSMAVNDIDRVVGLLMNAAPVRTRVPRDASVAEFLGAIQRQVGESTRFEQTSLLDVQRWSDVPARSPLFNSVVVFGNYPLDDARSGRASAITVEQPRSYGWTTVPLTLMVTPWQTFDIEARYDTAQVRPEMVQRLLDDALRTMTRLVGDPTRSIDAVEILSDEDRRQMLVEVNRTDAPGDEATIHGLFAEQARRTPGAIAYRCKGRTMTYAQLDRRSAGIARHLRERGVAPGTPIGVCIDPSPELPAALLGVLRAGCCYVPMDPTYPTARLEHIVRDAQPPFVLAVDGTVAAVPRVGPEIIDIGGVEPADPDEAMRTSDTGVSYFI